VRESLSEGLKAQTTGGPSASAPPAVRLVHLTKHFGEVVAVDDLTLELSENQFFAMLGPSGCGKTTTLRMIGGFEEPTRGRVELQGEDVTDRKPYQRPVNTVFQSYALFPHLTVAENVAFGLRRRRVPADEIRRRVSETLELVQLTGMDRRKPRQLSGGQQQRVALARALINHPRVLLLDEPLGALDLKLRKEMQIELKRIQNEVGITFIHVTHDQEEAMTMADSIAVMNEGRVERLGAPTEIYEDPLSAFVAEFLGASNLMPGRADGGALTLPDGTKIRVPRGARAQGRVGIRPEKVQLFAPGAAPDGMNRFRGKVVDASFVGVSTQYLVATPWQGEVTAVSQNLDDTPHAVGSEVDVAWQPHHSFLVE
jgi:spermidine/putrescine transport system ATP-binding protein